MDIGEVRDQWICHDGLWTRPGDPHSNKYRWLELRARPYDLGLHESGFRFLAFTGCWIDDDGEVQKEDLHQWADHAIFYGPVNIDVEPDGTLRIMSWGTGGDWINEDGFLGSSGMFHPSDYAKAISMMNTMRNVHEEPR
jgi:hypothetical protein